MTVPFHFAILRILILGCFVSFMETGLLSAPPSIEPLRRGAWSLAPVGDAWSVCVENHRAYVGLREAGLLIIDIRNPVAPKRLGGSTTKGVVYDIAVSGEYAYVADGRAGLRVLDVSDPAKPTTVGMLRLPVGDAVKVVLSGAFVYLLDTGAKMRIVDVSNPFSPVLIGTYPAAGRPVDVAASGNYVYLVNDASNQGFEAVDVSDPSHPTFVGGNEQWNWFGTCSGVALSGNLAYLSSEGGQFNIVDISDPTNQRLEGSLQTETARGVAASGNRVFMKLDNGIQIIDVSDPAHPVPADISYPESPSFASDRFYSGTVWDVAVSDNYAYLANHVNGMLVVDVGTTNCVSASNLGTSGAVYDVTVNGNLAYVAYGAAGLQAVDISDPSSPIQVGGVLDNSRGIEFSDNYVYAIGRTGVRSSGLSVYHVGNGTNLTRVSQISTSVALADLAVSGGFAYLASDNAGLQIVNVSNPTNISLVGGYKYEGPDSGLRPAAFGVAVSGNLVYLGYGSAGLLIVDASDPTNCVLLGRYDTPDTAVKIKVSGNLAFIADVLGGLQIINVADPAHPEFAGSYTNGSAIEGVTVRGTRVYVASGSAGFQVLDASDPGHCILLADDKTSRYPLAFDVANDRLYVADWKDGLRVLPHIQNAQFTVRVDGTPSMPLTIEATRTPEDSLTWMPLFTTNIFVAPFDFVDFDVAIAEGNHKSYRARQP